MEPPGSSPINRNSQLSLPPGTADGAACSQEPPEYRVSRCAKLCFCSLITFILLFGGLGVFNNFRNNGVRIADPLEGDELSEAGQAALEQEEGASDGDEEGTTDGFATEAPSILGPCNLCGGFEITADDLEVFGQGAEYRMTNPDGPLALTKQTYFAENIQNAARFAGTPEFLVNPSERTCADVAILGDSGFLSESACSAVQSLASENCGCELFSVEDLPETPDLGCPSGICAAGEVLTNPDAKLDFSGIGLDDLSNAQAELVDSTCAEWSDQLILFGNFITVDECSAFQFIARSVCGCILEEEIVVDEQEPEEEPEDELEDQPEDEPEDEPEAEPEEEPEEEPEPESEGTDAPTEGEADNVIDAEGEPEVFICNLCGGPDGQLGALGDFKAKVSLEIISIDEVTGTTTSSRENLKCGEWQELASVGEIPPEQCGVLQETAPNLCKCPAP